MKKKLVSTISIFLICLTLLFNFNITADAATVNKTVSTSHLVTLKNVANYTFSSNYVSTNIGGISVGAAYNRLYVIKSDSSELVTTLYYYTNLHSSAAPKRIIFRKGILGHANAMAVDNNYIYVTQWQKSETGEKSNVVRISRKAIHLLEDETRVLPSTNSVTDSDGNTIPIYTVYDPVNSSGNDYTRPIKAITKYSYSSSQTKFIVNYSYGTDNTELTYTFATLKDGVFTVHTDANSKFKVKNTKTGVTMQDIFYDDEYGFFVPVWKTDSTTSYLLRYDISSRSSTTATEPERVLTLTKNSDSNGSLSKYEIESLSFIERDTNRNETDFRLIFSCNKETTGGSGCDAIEEITSLSTYLPKL